MVAIWTVYNNNNGIRYYCIQADTVVLNRR